MASVRGALRTLLGQVLKLRRIPSLDFVPDESADYGERIDGILNRLGMDSARADAQEPDVTEEGAGESND